MNKHEVEKKERKKVKKKIPRLKDKLIIIKNADKDEGNWMESWNTPKNRSPGHIPHPFRLLALGRPGRGKTNVCKQIFLKHQSSAKKFKQLIIVTCDAESREWLDCEPTEVITELPDPSEFDGTIKTMIVVDDFELTKISTEEMRKLATLIRFTSTHKNVSIILSFQSFFDTHPIVRKCANVFVLYRPVSRQELTTISNRVGVDADLMHKLFKKKVSGTHDFLMVDHTVGTKHFLRKNIYEKIEIDDDSD
jgi:hypothetical protein